MFYVWRLGSNQSSYKPAAKLKCVRYLWMETYIRYLEDPEKSKRKYCYKRPVLGHIDSSEGDTYFFQMQRPLEESNKIANKILFKDGVEKKPATLESNNELVTHSESQLKASSTLCGGGKSIFHANFWVDENGNHPVPGTMISFSDVNNFVWKPVDRHQIDYCRYATRELEHSNLRLQISHHKRKVLLILHPQNDFCDRVPGLYPLEDVELVGLNDIATLELNPAKYNGKFAYQAADPRLPENGRRKGVVKGFRTKLVAGRKKYYVEVLWDPDVYRPSDLLVEGYTETDSTIRHFRRLQNACANHLRVHLASDERPDKDFSYKRYGRLVKVELTGVQVRWDLSVPSYVPKQELSIDSCDTSQVAVAVSDELDAATKVLKGSRVFYSRNVGQQAHSGVVAAADDVGPISPASPGANASLQRTVSTNRQASGNWNTSLYMYGKGTVVNDCGTHVEVLWDAENTCGNLAVLGSYTDLTYTAKLIRENWDQYDEIMISRDCHRCNHISHKSYWQTDGGVGDFRVIEYMDVLTGAVVPAQGQFVVSV
jgi:hypothetical protein